ncbi:MAG: hypothetical protein ACTH5B_21170 [Marinomonas sp.]|uniref:hypothetical protein n=1 Tax=Marinomonas sp. TaxID=1904862 RepID=UPI003F951C07
MAFTAQVTCDGQGCTEQVEFKDDSFLVHDQRNDLKNEGWIINHLTGQDFCPGCAKPVREAFERKPLEASNGHCQES